MIATVDAEQARTLALLEQLVNQNSGSLNLPGVEAVGRMMRAEFEAARLHGRVDRHEGEPAAPGTSSPVTRAMAAARRCC